MSWLLRDGDVLAALEDPHRGWQSSLHGAVILRRPAVVQTMTTSVALDTAWCVPAVVNGGQPCLRVRRITLLSRRRVSVPHLGHGVLLVAAAGTFERWRLRVGDNLEVRAA